MRTLRLVVEYDGTDYAGWQRQKGQRTIQGCLEAAFRAMTGQQVAVTGAGRTDAGVHALGQVASVRLDSRIPASGFLRGLNTHLPPDIAVIDLADAPADYNARRSARGKIYRYAIWNHAVRSPSRARTSWHVRAPLDLDAMRKAARSFVGVHDFAAFRASDCDRPTTVRHMSRADVGREGHLVAFEIEGTAFLKHMVRVMTGTLVAVGRGVLGAADIERLYQNGDRTQAGMTAPAHGLTLIRVMD